MSKKTFKEELKDVLAAPEPTEEERKEIERRVLSALAWRPMPKADFVRTLLSPTLAATEANVERCELSEDGKKVVIVHANGSMRWINVEGDNLFGIVVDVVKALDTY
jgi:hypothetical protein